MLNTKRREIDEIYEDKLVSQRRRRRSPVYSADVQFKWLQSLLVTTLFCIAIAITTMSVWPASMWVHLAISFGFGYSAVGVARFTLLLNPNMPFRRVNAISVVASMVVGTTNAYCWLQWGRVVNAAQEMKPVLFLGVLFTAICYYYFYSHDKHITSQRAIERARRQQSEHEKALLLSQLQQLQSQIEPHFLFNTLANICVLVDSDARKAKVMLEKLTALLRVTLRKSRALLVDVDEEVELVSCYLSIQKVRLGERLNHRLDIELGGRVINIPPMLLQPLVENAVIHGIEPKADGGEIVVKLYVEGEKLWIIVKDTGIGFQDAHSYHGHGIGLANIKDRLYRLFDGRAKLSIRENNDTGVIAEIVMPIDKGSIAISTDSRS